MERRAAAAEVTSACRTVLAAAAAGAVLLAAACGASAASAATGAAPAAWQRGGWTATAAGARAPAAAVIDGAAAWRAACGRLGLVADLAPDAWRACAAGPGLAVVVPAGRALTAAPAVADEEGVEVLVFTAAAAPTLQPTVYGWTMPSDGRRRAVVYRDGAAPTAVEQVVWISPP
jgi:hypothetical protein